MVSCGVSLEFTSYALRKRWRVISLDLPERYICAYLFTKDIHGLENAQDVDGLWDMASTAIDNYFGQFAPATKRYVAVLILDAKGDLRFNDFANRSSFNNGMGVCGSRTLYTLPSYLEEVVSAVGLT
jgi:hypothetical protein